MQKRWLAKSPIDSTQIDEIRSKLKVDSVVAELLLQRGIDSYDTAEQFFRPKLSELHDPFLMKNMAGAVDRLNQAIEKEEKVLLYGDYDVDGTTAVATLYSFLKNHIKNLDYYIPDRYSEGYGVSEQGIDFAIKEKFDLIITLDCGIKAVNTLNRAAENGVDVIVCDHHTPGDILPNALILDPKQFDCEYPYEELSGCGVGFKLLQGLIQKNQWKLEPLFELLDLLAISIGADIVQITGENRILCFHGLRLLNENPRVAFKEMLILANRSFPVSLTDVVFTIAPRINAAGRLRSGKYAVELMISDDLEEIRQLAAEINEDNLNRRELDQQITQEALSKLENQPEDRFSNVVYDDDWHKGVVGIVASRIIESHYKPTVVLTRSNGHFSGSARSVEGFDLYAAISKCEDLLEQFGGHTHAAGMTLLPENVEKFANRFEEVVKESIEVEQLTEQLEIDIEIGFDQLFTPEENRLKIPRLKRILNQFEPHGPGNMKPVFVSRNVFATDVRVLKDAHLKLRVVQPNSDVAIDAIGFNLAHKEDEVASGIPFDLAYTIETNRWNGKETIQLNIKDIREVI